MIITDELRRYVAIQCGRLHGAKCSGYNKLLEIADSIDEQYAKAREKAYNEGVYDAIDADKNALGYIKGPVDADGVPWHLGDKVDGMVGEITYLAVGYIGWQFRLGDAYTFECEKYHHVKPDSWERIIEDARTCLMSDEKTESMPTMRWKAELDELVERCRRLAGE